LTAKSSFCKSDNWKIKTLENNNFEKKESVLGSILVQNVLASFLLAVSSEAIFFCSKIKSGKIATKEFLS